MKIVDDMSVIRKKLRTSLKQFSVHTRYLRIHSGKATTLPNPYLRCVGRGLHFEGPHPTGFRLVTSRHFISQDFFTPSYPNYNPNTNPDPNHYNHNSAVAVTCLKIKGREMTCFEMNCPVPYPTFCHFHLSYIGVSNGLVETI